MDLWKQTSRKARTSTLKSSITTNNYLPKKAKGPAQKLPKRSKRSKRSNRISDFPTLLDKDEALLSHEYPIAGNPEGTLYQYEDYAFLHGKLSSTRSQMSSFSKQVEHEMQIWKDKKALTQEEILCFTLRLDVATETNEHMQATLNELRSKLKA